MPVAAPYRFVVDSIAANVCANAANGTLFIARGARQRAGASAATAAHENRRGGRSGSGPVATGPAGVRCGIVRIGIRPARAGFRRRPCRGRSGAATVVPSRRLGLQPPGLGRRPTHNASIVDRKRHDNAIGRRRVSGGAIVVVGCAAGVLLVTGAVGEDAGGPLRAVWPAHRVSSGRSSVGGACCSCSRSGRKVGAVAVGRDVERRR